MLICESLQSSFIAFPLVVDLENSSILNTFGNSSDATEPSMSRQTREWNSSMNSHEARARVRNSNREVSVRQHCDGLGKEMMDAFASLPLPFMCNKSLQLNLRGEHVCILAWSDLIMNRV